jgi:hemin uptake protein HemP
MDNQPRFQTDTAHGNGTAAHTATRQAGPGRDGAQAPVKVRDLIAPGQVLELDHDGQIYRLRITRNRKLILTK